LVGLVFLILTVVLAQVEEPPKPGMRLISFNESYSQWMTEDEVSALAECGAETNFMDITEHQQIIKNTKTYFIPTDPTHQAVVNPLLPLVSIDSIWGTIASLSAYSTRYYTSNTGVESANWLLNQYRSHARHAWTTAAPYAHTWPQPSIIGRIEGTVASNEIVIIGGHIDSISSGATAPGADDDASGSSTVLEVFRVLTQQGFRGERTLEFHGYAAEEVGLRGSQVIANAYAQQGKDVVAMLQLDMTGYVRSGTNPTIGIITDFTNAALNAFIRKLVTEYTDANWANTACGYACSDHASWNRAGYVDGFTFEATFSNSNPNIHTVRDTISLLNKNHALEIARFALSFMVELSYAE